MNLGNTIPNPLNLNENMDYYNGAICNKDRSEQKKEMKI
jgi:hypothetical protein